MIENWQENMARKWHAWVLNTIYRSNIASHFSYLDEKVFTSYRKNICSKYFASISDSVDGKNLINICDDNDNTPENDQETVFIYNGFGENEICYRCWGCGLCAHIDCRGADAPDTYIYGIIVSPNNGFSTILNWNIWQRLSE